MLNLLIYINFKNIFNISQGCQKQMNEPWGSNFPMMAQNVVYSTDYTGKTFKNGKVRVKNLFHTDFNFIKFRLKLFDKTRKEFFSETISSNITFPGGDIVEIEVPGLKSYYADFPINNKDWTFEFQLLEISPNPRASLAFCKQLTEAKNLAREKNQ